ncbi:MAG: amino acid adenylation domain-containing protein [Acidobacteriota bacterium]
MSSVSALPLLLETTAAAVPYGIAVEYPPSATISYSGLDALSGRVRDRLRAMGVRPGDRVGLYVKKSIDAVAAIFGVMKAGAAYVPVDIAAPVSRCAYILSDCWVSAVIIERSVAVEFAEETRRLGRDARLLVLDDCGSGYPLRAELDRLDTSTPAPPSASVPLRPDDVAYILYTSGSTGKPKGVVLSHLNALSFVDWCSETFQPEADERFSSHAPFHFDLSILDIYLPLKHGATVVLIDEMTARNPVALAEIVAERRISSWYSTPSTLTLLAQFGRLDRCELSSLKRVLFAGEVFAPKYLRLLKRAIPHARYYNLYGPTETNVCTWCEIPATIPEDRTEPFAIGSVCAHLRGKVVDEAGGEVPAGVEGELCITGTGVMKGYWNLPERTAEAFFFDSDGVRWYKTGDIVTQSPDGTYTFIGRRDRMVKRHGYRIELGEIEAALHSHPKISEAAVVATSDPDGCVRIRAHVSGREGARPSIIELKRFCAEVLPIFMVPDAFAIERELPKTSTGKVDYQRLV